MIFFCVSNVTDEKRSSRATRRRSSVKHITSGQQQFTAHTLLETEVSRFISHPDHLSATVDNQYAHYQTHNEQVKLREKGCRQQE